MDADRPQSVIPKACVNCRIRKIRCNRRFPCSSCEASGIQCQFGPPGRAQPGSALRRPSAVHRQTDSLGLSESLAKIHESLQQLLSLHERRDNFSPGSTSSSKKSPAVAVEEPDLTEIRPPVYEGASSFSTQAIAASEESQSLARDSAQLAAARDGLRLLRDIVGTTSPQGAVDSPKPRVATTGRKAIDMQLPPTEFVVQLLKTFKPQDSVALLGFFTGGIDRLEQLCQAAYFPTEPISLGALTVMHGLLYFLIQERSHLYGPATSESYSDEEMTKLCEENVERGIRSYEVFAVPSMENANALLIAANKYLDDCDVNRSWVLIGSAARQVLSLGLHRQASYAELPVADAQHQRMVFWATYLLDKNLSLALGQTSTIQDRDVDVEMYQSQLGPELEPWERAVTVYAHLARIQGDIYDRLYTASALKQPLEDRRQIISQLSGAIENWRQSHTWDATPDCHQPAFYDLVYRQPSKVVYYSLLTTLHRSATGPGEPPGKITRACYEAACRSLESHLELFPSMKQHDSSNLDMAHSYMTWSLIYWSFTPLIVVFLHAISSLNGRDLELLVRFKETMEQVQAPKEGTLNLLRASEIFSAVAQAYIESKPSNRDAVATAGHGDTVVRHENVQLAFEAPQAANADVPAEPMQDWAQLENNQLDGMYNLVDNWIDGSHFSFPVEYFNMDPSQWSGQ